MSQTPLFCGAVSNEVATLTAPTAVTSRANIAGTTGLTKLTNASTLGRRVDSITAKGKATNAATNLFVWLYDGTTSMLLTELDLPAVTAGNTADSVEVTKQFPVPLNLTATQQLYVSVTVSADLNVFAPGGTY